MDELDEIQKAPDELIAEQAKKVADDLIAFQVEVDGVAVDVTHVEVSSTPKIMGAQTQRVLVAAMALLAPLKSPAFKQLLADALTLDNMVVELAPYEDGDFIEEEMTDEELEENTTGLWTAMMDAHRFLSQELWSRGFSPAELGAQRLGINAAALGVLGNESAPIAETRRLAQLIADRFDLVAQMNVPMLLQMANEVDLERIGLAYAIEYKRRLAEIRRAKK